MLRTTPRTSSASRSASCTAAFLREHPRRHRRRSAPGRFRRRQGVRQMPQTRRPPMKGKPGTWLRRRSGARTTRVSDVWEPRSSCGAPYRRAPVSRRDDDALAQCVLCAPIRDRASSRQSPPALDAIVRKGLERDPSRGSRRPVKWPLRSNKPHPCAASEVGATVERMCGEAIATRAERIRESASAPATQGLPATPIVPSREFIADALWGPRQNSPPLAHPNLSPEPADVAQGLPNVSLRSPRSGAARRWGIAP